MDKKIVLVKLPRLISLRKNNDIEVYDKKFNHFLLQPIARNYFRKVL